MIYPGKRYFGRAPIPAWARFLLNVCLNVRSSIRTGEQPTSGRALVELALDPEAYGKVWHLPVGPQITLNDLLAIINHHLGTSFKFSVIPTPVLSVLSRIVPIIGDLKEMLYRFNEPYVMSDKAFRSRYPNFKTTSTEEGLVAMVESFRGTDT